MAEPNVLREPPRTRLLRRELRDLHAVLRHRQTPAETVTVADSAQRN